MADATTKRILQLLNDDQPREIRLSALRVLAEIATPDSDVGKSIALIVADADEELRVLAILTAGKFKVQEALPALLARVQEGGEGAEQAAQSAARLGAKAVKALHDLMPKIAPGLRRYIASALGAGGSVSADHAALEFLQDSDPGVVDAAVRGLIAQIPELSPAKRKALTEPLLDLLKAEKGSLTKAAEMAALRLLSALAEPRAEPYFWQRVTARHSLELRVAALQALGKLGKAPGKDHLAALFACAGDRDFRIAAPALMILQHQAANAKTLPHWLALFEGSDVGARRLALEKLAEHDTPEVAAVLTGQMRHPDKSYRDAVLEQLTKRSHGQEMLVEALLAAQNADAAWSLARSQAPFAKSYPAPLQDKLFAQACKHLEGGDRRNEALLFLLREADEKGLQAKLEARGVALRKKKDYDKAVLYLRQVARDPASGFALRFELAGCGLKVSQKELAHEARSNDPCLGQFFHLVQNYEAELSGLIDKAKWLEPEDLFYLGFHFSEREGIYKQFGGKVLASVVKRSPKTKVGQAAKTKLKAMGLG